MTAKKTKKLRIGVAGLKMGRHHVMNLSQHKKCEVAAIADPDADLLKSVGDEFHIKQRYAQAEEMFENADLDAVSIVVPNTLHCPLTLAAFARGLHVLCEKPMAMNVGEAQRMKAAADRAGKTLMINLSFRFSNISYALKQQVDAGLIGTIYFGRTVWHRRCTFPDRPSFRTKEISGGGPLIDLGVHRIDLALWLMGHPEPISVSGATYDILAQKRTWPKGAPFTVEDLACGMIKFKNGATLIVEASWIINAGPGENMLTQLYGDKGSIVQRNIDSSYEFTGEIYTQEAGNFYRKILDHAAAPAPTSYHEFVDCLIENRPPLATADDGIRVQKILDALYASAETGKEITL